MELLFIDALSASFDMAHVYRHCGISLALWVLVILASLIDLWDGVHTARVLKQRVHSHKLRVTIAKLGEYWRIMLLGFVADTIGVLFPFYALPYLSILICLGIIAIEIKSVFEHAEKRKSKTAELPSIVQSIVECVSERDAESVLKRIIDELDDYRRNETNK